MLVILASCNDDSINGKILESLRGYLEKENIYLNILKLSKFKEIPILLHKSEVPGQILEIYSEIQKYECLVIFAPEHNAYFSSFFKNILDWLSLKDKVFLEGKKVILVSVSETEKEKRIMEEGVKNTLNRLGAKDIRFFNYNKYKEGEINSEQIKKLAKYLWS